MRFSTQWERVKLVLWTLSLLALAVAGSAGDYWE